MKQLTIIPLALAALLPGCNTDTPCPAGFQEYTCQPVTDEPGTQPDQQLLEWQVTATFAITYQVQPKSAAFQDGYTVTVFNTDRTATTVKSKKKPGPEAVTWSPLPEGLPGVISVAVHQVDVTGGKSDEE